MTIRRVRANRSPGFQIVENQPVAGFYYQDILHFTVLGDYKHKFIMICQILTIAESKISHFWFFFGPSITSESDSSFHGYVRDPMCMYEHSIVQ